MKRRILYVSIYSPEKVVFEGEIRVITLPGAAGSFNILTNHAPIVSTLKKGAVVYELPDGSIHTIDIRGGFIEMRNNILSVCITG